MTTDRLSEDELDRLEDLLFKFDGERAMNLEEVDGFFAALVCGPELVMPGECLPEIWDGESGQGADALQGIEELQEFLNLLTGHWNSIAGTLFSGDILLPLLLEGADGVCHGNDWARGFMRGVAMRHDAWLELFQDEEQSGLLIPILALFHENDPDPEMRPYPGSPTAEMREKLIVGMAASVRGIYEYFAPHRRMTALAQGDLGSEPKKSKVGRNDPCPCGSGKKYKRCCGQTTVQ